jgi:hypothetical protein
MIYNKTFLYGSGPLTNGSGSGSGYFLPRPSRHPQKTNLKKFFCILLFEGIFTKFFKEKSHKEVEKQQESRFFLVFLLDDSRIQEAQKRREKQPRIKSRLCVRCD